MYIDQLPGYIRQYQAVLFSTTQIGQWSQALNQVKGTTSRAKRREHVGGIRQRPRTRR